jgi:hypothetical protein
LTSSVGPFVTSCSDLRHYLRATDVGEC